MYILHWMPQKLSSGLVSMPLNSNGNACGMEDTWENDFLFPFEGLVQRVQTTNKNGLRKEIGSVWIRGVHDCLLQSQEPFSHKWIDPKDSTYAGISLLAWPRTIGLTWIHFESHEDPWLVLRLLKKGNTHFVSHRFPLSSLSTFSEALDRPASHDRCGSTTVKIPRLYLSSLAGTWGESVGNVVETMLVALQPSAHSRTIDEGQLLGVDQNLFYLPNKHSCMLCHGIILRSLQQLNDQE